MSKLRSLSALLFVLLSGCVLLTSAAKAQTTAPNQWTWMGGNDVFTADSTVLGVYGTLGTPATANVPSGRYGPAGWIDKNGNLWFFGGFGATVSLYFVDQLDDLWEFYPTTKEWAWMGGSYPYMGQLGVYGTLGVPAAENWPGSRQNASTWTDASGNFWLFGGLGTDANKQNNWLNDLWEFSPSSGYWTWLGGASTTTNGVGGVAGGQPGVYGTLKIPAAGNVPGGRWGASAWTDSEGNAWLFGGFGYDSAGITGELNDLWMLNLATREWTWMGGSSTVPLTNPSNIKNDIGKCDPYAPFTCGQPGIYGNLQAPAAANTPGGRDSAAAWTDRSGNLWLFAGEGFDSLDNWGTLNDLWEFNPATNEWTWMGGSFLAYPTAVYGTLQTPSIANIPAGSYGASAWTDNNGKFWLFGGGFAVYGDESGSQDLWEFDPATSEWAWMGGNQNSQSGNPAFGTLGVPAPGNIPGGLYSAANVADANGNFWLFGGYGYLQGTFSYINDLWEFEPSAPAAAPSFAVYTSPAPITLGQGNSGTTTVSVVVAGGFNSPVALTASGQPAGVSVSFSPSSISGAGSSQMAISVDSSAPAGNYTLKVTGASGSTLETASVSLTVLTPTFALSASPASQDVDAGETVTTTITSTVTDGFNSPIALTASGQPAGTIVSFNPSTIAAGGSSDMTISVPLTVSPGDCCNIVVTGTGGGLTETTSPGLSLFFEPIFSLSTPATAVSVSPGATTGNASTVTVTPSFGFTGSVALTAAVTSSPTGAVNLPTLSFGATTPVSITSTAAGTATLTISTTAASTTSCSAMNQTHPPIPWKAGGGAALACLLLFRIPARRRKLRGLLGMLVLLGAFAGAAMGCGGGGGASNGGGGSSCTPQTVAGTTSGAYIITVTATSGAITQTGTVALTVQ